MTYQNDPNRRRRVPGDDKSYTGWIIGGAIAIAVIIGLFTMFGRDHTNTASNDANRPAATAPTTTGSAATGAGTANTPVPTPPAKPAAPANR